MSNKVQNPITNSPFVEPKLHWLIKHGKSPVKAEGRRPASYYYRVPESAERGRKNKNQMTEA
jgi:type III restriction enzyme